MIKRIVDLENLSNISVEKENYICKDLEGMKVEDENNFNIYIYPLINTEEGIKYFDEKDLFYDVGTLENYYSEYDERIDKENLITYIYGEEDVMLPLTGKFFTREKYLVLISSMILLSYWAIRKKRLKER